MTFECTGKYLLVYSGFKFAPALKFQHNIPVNSIQAISFKCMGNVFSESDISRNLTSVGPISITYYQKSFFVKCPFCCLL